MYRVVLRFPEFSLIPRAFAYLDCDVPHNACSPPKGSCHNRQAVRSDGCMVPVSYTHLRTNKEGKTFLVFPLRVMIPDTDGKTMPIEVDVSKDTAGKEVSKYRNGSRIEVSGTMYLKHRGDKLYFNLFINEIRTATADAKDTVKGEFCLLYTSCWFMDGTGKICRYRCGYCSHRQSF